MTVDIGPSSIDSEKSILEKSGANQSILPQINIFEM